MNKKNLIIGIICILLVFIVFRVVRKFMLNKGTKEAKETLVPVKVSESGKEDVEEIINLTGDVRGLSEIKIYPKVPGKLLKKVKDLGDVVEKDEVLVLIDRDEPAMKFSLAETKSPMKGVVTQYFTDIGNVVSPQTPILEVASIDKVKIIVNIVEKYIPKLSKGLKARFTVDAYPDEVFEGILSKISQTLDFATRTVPVEITLDNPKNLLKPGMFARVELILSVHKNVITIPKDAIISGIDEKFVFVIENNAAVKKEVKIGLVVLDRAEIIEGLNKDEKVVTVGWQNLKDGSIVEVVER